MSSQKTQIKDGITYKYHTDGTVHAKGKIKDGKPSGYWEWFRKDGTIKRSGTFKDGEPVGEWTTYDKNGKVVRITQR